MSPCDFLPGLNVDNQFGGTFLCSARQQIEEWRCGGGISDCVLRALKGVGFESVGGWGWEEAAKELFFFPRPTFFILTNRDGEFPRLPRPAPAAQPMGGGSGSEGAGPGGCACLVRESS